MQRYAMKMYDPFPSLSKPTPALEENTDHFYKGRGPCPIGDHMCDSMRENRATFCKGYCMSERKKEAQDG